MEEVSKLELWSPKDTLAPRARAEDTCFGLPHRGVIAGIVIGGLLLLGGIFALAQQQGWITRAPDLGWSVLIIFGVLIVAGAIYRMRRRL